MIIFSPQYFDNIYGVLLGNFVPLPQEVYSRLILASGKITVKLLF